MSLNLKLLIKEVEDRTSVLNNNKINSHYQQSVEKE